MGADFKRHSDPPVEPTEVLRLARERIQENTHFAKHDDCVRFDMEGGRLVLSGRVPSFYLKSVLQNALANLPGVQGIENRVDVVASDGLSSTVEQGDREPSCSTPHFKRSKQ